MSMPMDPNASLHDAEAFYRGWFSRSMPDTNMKNPYMLQYFKQWAVWWIENMDIDGFRVDTYPYNDKHAMAAWVGSVRDEYPDFTIVGESWLQHPSQIAYWVGGNGNRDGFDSNLPFGMDFPLMSAIHGAMRSGEDRVPRSAGGIYDVMTQDFLYRDPARELMVFLDNHDTEHIADIVAGDPDKVRLALTILATVRGMPQMWVGTELLFRSKDLRQGHVGARIDFPGGWRGDERDLFSQEDRTPDEQAVFAHAKKLFNWRKGKEVIHTGRTMQFVPRGGLWVFFRYDDGEAVMTAVNVSPQTARLDWNVYREMVAPGTSGREVLSGENVKAGDDYELPPYGSAVIEFTR
jgi:1,4-alpha-glucan branching enzyme